VLRRLTALIVVVALPLPAFAQSAVEAARAAITRYHEDPALIDRARAQLEAELTRDRRVETMVLLARVCFLAGDVRARTSDDKLAAYDRGREIGKRAVELAPKDVGAHLWYAINTGRWGQTKGVLRSLFLLPTLREELDVIFALDPRSASAHLLAGNVFFEVPALFGGDRAKAEASYRKAIEIDPRFTAIRVELARLLIATDRVGEARRELQRVIDERAPTSIADWTVKDLPRARALLASLGDRT
jgi:tetratricopeptide (TPR) repeat protein